MENALFANVQKLYDHRLYESVIPAASLLSTLLQNDRDVATLEMEYQVMLYLANAHYKERNFRLAHQQLESVLHTRRTMLRFKSACLTAIEMMNSQFTDAELRYQLAVCYKEVGEPTKAISTLQALPAKTRTPRINLLLARLHHHASPGSKGKADAALSYKEVLRECPMSLKSIEALLELGVDGIEVNSLVMNAAPAPRNIEWLSTWIKGLALLYGCKHLEASRAFQRLNDNTKLRRNEHLLVEIGRCLYYYGNHLQAEQYLSSAVMAYPNNMEAISLLSVVYELNEQSADEQEKLFTRVTADREFSPAHWFVHGQKMYSDAKYQRGLAFVERCLDMDPRHIEGHLLRGNLLIALKRYGEAIVAFRNVQGLASYRFEVYKGLFHCYVAQKRFKEAQTMCVWAIRSFRTSPRSYTMFGRTLFHSTNPVAKRSAKKFVERSLKIDSSYTPAVALMAEICQYEGATKAAIRLLEKQVINYPNQNLYTLLGDILRIEKQPFKALDYYYRALSVDSKCVRAINGINSLKLGGSVGGEGSKDAAATAPDTEPGRADGLATPTPTPTPSETANQEWQIVHSNEPLEMSSESGASDSNGDEAVNISEPFWQDVEMLSQE
ncbi:anaphase-promoting complex subunit 7 [Drosophila guanche]|uniref:Blast:Anaphase-promoting complex subunit 7 n=1 Tax=Drosophila guanche TaxID=7266 RepID=A0A3B0JF31_DROGU|nr:anaphase-promoting complex subunit 7 [Drosophila guanche]SPP78812.1 blast:Anaphase-promoting complex subunit 7 [Drosophila guanche]